MDTPALTATSGVKQATQPSQHDTTAAVAKTPVVNGQAKSAADALPHEAIKPQRDPRTLQFQVENGRIVTTIVDSESKSVITQIPDDEVIRLAEAIDRLKGFFVQDEA